MTHNESISIADYYTVRDGRKVRVPADLSLRLPSCNDAVLSLHEMSGAAGERQTVIAHPR